MRRVGSSTRLAREARSTVFATELALASASRRERREASALVAVLWAVAILATVVISMAYSVRLELRIAKNLGDREAARWLALAGVEKAKALVYHRTRGSAAGSTRCDRSLYDDPREFRDVELGRGVFRVTRPPRGNETASVIFGIEDEESRLDLNHATVDELSRLEFIDETIAHSIQDWRDDDSELSPSGAEDEYYRSLGYRIRNGPFESLAELGLVRGVTRSRLVGEDVDLDGQLDANENDGDLSEPLDNADGRLDRGLMSYFGHDAAAANIDGRGKARLDLSIATAEDLAKLPGLSSDIARAIVAHREQKNFESLADLLWVAAPKEEGRDGSGARATVDAPTPGGPPDGGRGRGTGDGRPDSDANREPDGEPLITSAMLQAFADEVTANQEPTIAGALNVNTASVEILACLEGIDRDLAQSIIDERERQGGFENVAGLLSVEGITRDVFKKIEPRLTTRGNTFRVRSEGRIPSTGARYRVEALFRIEDFDVQVLYFREGS